MHAYCGEVREEGGKRKKRSIGWREKGSKKLGKWENHENEKGGGRMSLKMSRKGLSLQKIPLNVLLTASENKANVFNGMR